MGKDKRGKSGSASELVRWDTELMKIPYVEDDWKPFIVFLIPSKSTDVPVISLLTDMINTGIRKLFSVIEYNSLLDEVKDLTQGKAAKGKAPVATTKPPQFLEVCEQVKSLMDQDEPISVSMVAKVVKFKMLMLKNKDLDRREVEKKIASMDSKQRVDSRSGSKSSNRKSASPGKGKKTAGGKKEENNLSPKKETQMKKRGEESDDFKTVDDEPDGITDPQHYIIITGFTDASLINHLIDMKIPIDLVINFDTDYHLKLVDDSADPSETDSVEQIESNNTDVGSVDKKQCDTQLASFWENLNSLVQGAPHGHYLHNVARYDIFVGDQSLPDVSFDACDAEKKNQFCIWLFNKLALVCYDMLDYYQQYKVYLDSLQVIDVSATHHQSKPASLLSSDSTAVEFEQEAIGVDTSMSEVHPASVDMRYYNHLLDNIPMESDSVPLLLHCLLEQVVVTTDEKSPIDEEPPKRNDGLNNLLGDYLDEKLASYGFCSKEKISKKKTVQRISPHIVNHGDASALRLINSVKNPYLDPEDIETRLLQSHPYSAFPAYLQNTYDEEVESYIRHRQFYNFCNARYPMSEEKFERALRQYIFESLPIGIPIDSSNSQRTEGQCKDNGDIGKALHQWDNFYFDLLKSESSLAVAKESSDDVVEKKSAPLNLDGYCCIEKLSPSVLLQVLEKAHDLTPYLDTYYNRGNNTLLIVLQNPTSDGLQNNSEWSSWLHSNVGFKNYLEYVAFEVQDWSMEQVRLENAKMKAILPEPEESFTVIVPAKERSRWGMKTRSETEKEEEENNGDKRKKSGKKSASPQKSASKSRSPQKKKSEKDGKRSNSGKGDSLSSTSKVSITSDEVPVIGDVKKDYDFIGYNLGDNIVNVSGDLVHLFPQDGSLIKVERTKYIHGNQHVTISVIKNGDVFSLNLINPSIPTTTNDDENVQVSSDISTELSSETVPEENDTASNGQDAIPAMPSLPDIDTKSCLYSNIRASFRDGTIIVCSNSINPPPEKIPAIDSEPLLDQSDSVPTESSHQGKSAKVKGKKKEEDTKAQEESEKLHAQQMENDRLLQQRLDDITRLTKEKEAMKNLYVTSPNGLHTSYLHHMDVQYGDNNVISQSSFLVKFEDFTKVASPDLTSTDGTATELYRCVTEEGLIIQYLSDSTVKILSPLGDIMQSTPFPTDTLKSPKSTERPSSTMKDAPSSEALDADHVVSSKQVDWFITHSSGKQTLMKADGSEEDVNELLLSHAKCYETNEVLHTREDGVLIINRPDGSTIVEYLDGTRVTSSVSGAHAHTSSHDVIKVEHEALPTVCVNKNEMSLSVYYHGNTKMIKGMKSGGYVITKDGSSEMIIDKDGNASLHPNHEVSLTRDHAIELSANEMKAESTCLLQQSSEECLNLVDNVGNNFAVNLFGECSIAKNEQCIPRATVPPRYFVVYLNGEGEELLTQQDIYESIRELEGDARSAIVRNNVEGDDEAESITVIKPYYNLPLKICQPKKRVEDIIPKGLRERDFKPFPSVEVKKEGKSLGKRLCAPKKEIKVEECLPHVLETRNFIRYPELLPEVREEIVKAISEYSEYVQQQQQFNEFLLNKESRNEEEIAKTEKLKEKYLLLKKCEVDVARDDRAEEVTKTYQEATAPVPVPPAPRAQPERLPGEWENDKAELNDLYHAKSVIRNRDFPKYFDTQDVIQSTPYRNRNDTSLFSMDSSTMSVICHDTSGMSDVTYNTPDLKVDPSRPVNPTPGKSDVCNVPHDDDSKLNPIDETMFNSSLDLDAQCNEIEESSADETQKQSDGTPTSTLGSRPFPTQRLNQIEEPVRRQIKTASIAGVSDISCLRGFVLIPDHIDFGSLREGVGYSYHVTLKNVGIDQCRFKIKPPPPSTGLKVIYQPGPVAAGMSITFDVEILAIAVGVESHVGVGQVSHDIEIITETDTLYFPVSATIITQNEDSNVDVPRDTGPSKGVVILKERPTSRETLTRPRKI